MSKGWREVARLGGTGARYPHVLADAHGWCLRLGPKSRTDDKYYSSLPLLLHGLVQHAVRRRLMALSASLDLQDLCREVRDALHTALGLCQEALEKGDREEHIRRLEPSKLIPSRGVTSTDVSIAQGGGDAFSAPCQGRRAV
jgi:hypothetical protein